MCKSLVRASNVTITNSDGPSPWDAIGLGGRKAGQICLSKSHMLMVSWTSLVVKRVLAFAGANSDN
uniref:Uncharacterized protein n=1 Tax=Leersia perrieri TaxID=77586 RepID=A0A0D9X3A0_9ORYZ